MSEKIETRTLIIRPTDATLISPIEPGRLTFAHNVATTENDLPIPPYIAMEQAMENSPLDLPPVSTRRHLGKVGSAEAFVASTYFNQKIPRNFTKRFHDIESIKVAMELNPEAYDQTDVEIFRRYVNFLAEEL